MEFEVSSDQFYKKIGPLEGIEMSLDHGSKGSFYPTKCNFYYRHNRMVVGYVTEYFINGKSGLTEKKHFLINPHQP